MNLKEQNDIIIKNAERAASMAYQAVFNLLSVRVDPEADPDGYMQNAKRCRRLAELSAVRAAARVAADLTMACSDPDK
jgi:hypothetical protein